MAQSKTEKRNSARKIAEAKSQAKKAARTGKVQTSAGGRPVKGKKSLTAGKKK